MLMIDMTEITVYRPLLDEIPLGHSVRDMSPTPWWEVMTGIAIPLVGLMTG
jgi:hypothetical protein